MLYVDLKFDRVHCFSKSDVIYHCSVTDLEFCCRYFNHAILFQPWNAGALFIELMWLSKGLFLYFRIYLFEFVLNNFNVAVACHLQLNGLQPKFVFIYCQVPLIDTY